MILAQPTPDEADRLAALRQYGVLDTLPEQELDDLTSLAATICGAPIAMISLIDERRQWFKSKVGLEMAETARDISFCGHAVHQRELFIVPDARQDERFADNPLVTGDPGFCFYAGAPLVSSADVALGTLCVIDRVPRTLTQAQEQALRVLARQVIIYLDLRRQMRELVESEERLRVATNNVIVANTASHWLSSIVEGSDDAIIGKDLNSIITSWNKGAEKIFGYSASEMVGTSITRLIPDDRLGEETRILNKIRLGENVDHFETLRQTKDGRLIDVSVTASPIKDATGKVVGVSKVARDITERKRAEEHIAEQAAFLDKARDAILVRDLEGRILFWNSGAERIYGWMRQEAIGRNIGDLLYTDPRKFEEVNGRAISQGEWHGELQHITKDKGEITIEARWTLIRDNEGHPKAVLAINTDITEKKKIEAQFMRAQRMESIGTLAGGIAHDLNNILAPIMMAIEILQELSTDPQAKNILRTIEVSAKRGADIVRQVLSFSRGLEGERIEVQPKHLLKDLESIIKDTFPKDIRLQFSVPNDIWTILGDPTQVHQILLNLCVNARDAMPSGGTLTIGVDNCVLDEQYAAMNIQAKPGRYVNISVTDSGTGIPPDLVDKIFEPFFTTKAVSKGTGLGLSTVMAIVKSHDGIINVYSEPGKGTTFKVYLPAMETSSEGRKEQSEGANLPRGNGETVLVVDDEASILTITSQTLQAFGYRVVTAMDGADALSVYVQHRKEIAVVLTDMMMPVLDGPATIHALMRINPNVKIIAASGLNSNGGEAKVAGEGVKHFLTKPYTAATLLKTLRTILDEA